MADQLNAPGAGVVDQDHLVDRIPRIVVDGLHAGCRERGLVTEGDDHADRWGTVDASPHVVGALKRAVVDPGIQPPPVDCVLESPTTGPMGPGLGLGVQGRRTFHGPPVV